MWYVPSRITRKLLPDIWCPSARLMRANSLDSGLMFSGGNGSLLVSSSGQFHVTKLAQTKSQEVIITMRASLRHVIGYSLYYWWAMSRSDQYCRFDATKIAPLISIWLSGENVQVVFTLNKIVDVIPTIILTSPSLYQDNDSAVNTNQNSLLPPLIKLILCKANQPFLITCE